MFVQLATLKIDTRSYEQQLLLTISSQDKVYTRSTRNLSAGDLRYLEGGFRITVIACVLSTSCQAGVAETLELWSGKIFTCIVEALYVYSEVAKQSIIHGF